MTRCGGIVRTASCNGANAQVFREAHRLQQVHNANDQWKHKYVRDESVSRVHPGVPAWSIDARNSYSVCTYMDSQSISVSF